MSRISVDMPAISELSTIAAENHPNRMAFADAGGDSITWKTFEERSRMAADALTDHIRPGDRVAILSESSIETTVVWNGALKAGGVVSYLHTKASPDSVRYAIDEIRPSVLAVHEEFAEFVATDVRDDLESDPFVFIIGERTDDFEHTYEDFVADATATTPDVLHAEEDIAAIVWTSGTTGRPKGWCHTNRSILLKGMMADLDRSTTLLSSASPSFMAWYGHVISAMSVGAAIVYLRDWNPMEWVQTVETYGVTNAGMVPTMWRAVLDLDLDQHDLSSLETISFVGEKMDRTTLDRLRAEVCSEVVNHYASTEHLIARMSADEMKGDRIESVGKPFHGVRVRIIEPNGEPDEVKPPREIGEIIVKSADCPVWVWGRSDAAAREYRDGWWYSGDMGYFDDDGYLFLEGRKDFMIKSKGVKVYPAPIEERLQNHPAIAEAVVVGLEDEEYGQQVTAVVTRSSDDVDAEALDAWCLEADAIARFERPREYIFSDETIPRTPSQKLDRKRVIEQIESDELG